jgi:peptide/nickel transport system permease protein
MAYMLGRLLVAVPILVGLSLVMFVLVHLAPGDPVSALIQPGASPQFIAQTRKNFGLDKPLPVQYVRYVQRLVQGDLGTAYSFNGKPVTELIKSRAPATISLQVISLSLALILAIPLGILSATRQYSFLDNSTTVGSFIGLALPNFWLALLLQYYFGVKLHWLPTISSSSVGAIPRASTWKYFVLPIIVLTLPSIAYFARFMRSAMLEVLHQDYMTTARAKGVTDRIVLYRHGLRNAFIPMITVSGLQVARILSGAVIIEQIFAWPGLGALSYDAITKRDYPVVLGVTIVAGAFVILINILVDLLYVLIDPRVKLG